MLKHCHATAIEHRRGNSQRSLKSVNSPDNSSLNSSNSSSSGSSSTGSVNCSFVGSETSASSSFVLASPVSMTNTSSNIANTSINTSISSSAIPNTGNHPADSRRSSYSSPEPLSMASRTSSYASLSTTDGSLIHANGTGPRSTIKIYAKCLKQNIEYKTLSISRNTTSAEVIWMLLSKFKMRHRDPKLFYLTMDIGVAALSRTLSLDEDSRPAELKSCHPWGECRFTLQMRRGGLVRVHDSILMAESRYKCLLISENTSVREVVTILFHCYGLERIERVDRYVLCEVAQNNFERRLHPDDCPASIQQGWDDPKSYQFILKRNNVLSLSVSVNSSSPISSSNSVSGMSPTSDCSSSTISSSASVDEAMDTSYSTSSSDCSHSSPSPSPDVFRQVQTSSSVNSQNVMKTAKVVSSSALPNPMFMRSSAVSVAGSKPVVAGSKTVVTSGLNPAVEGSNSVVASSILRANRFDSKLPKFNINGPVTTQVKSFHEVGLPPVLRPKLPKQQASLLLANGSRGNILTHHIRTKFHDYENYFYI